MTTALATAARGIGADERAAPRIRRLLTVRPAPRREPPFDDELPPDACAHSPWDRPLPFDRAAPAPQPVAVRRLDPQLPEPARWGRGLLIGLAESAAGKRPLHQLDNLLTPAIAHGLRSELVRGDGRRHWLHLAAIRTVRAMQPCAGVAEITATVQVGQRVRAIALRIERRHDQWRCTRIQLG